MPSSPADPQTLLVELASAWDHAYEALVRGDLPRVGALMDTAEGLTRRLPSSLGTDARLGELHNAATAAYGRLHAAMRQGLDVVQQELTQVRKGQRVLAGYADPTHGLGGRLEARV